MRYVGDQIAFEMRPPNDEDIKRWIAIAKAEQKETDITFVESLGCLGSTHCGLKIHD